MGELTLKIYKIKPNKKEFGFKRVIKIFKQNKSLHKSQAIIVKNKKI